MTFDLHLYNTASKTVERVEPVTPGKLALYLCGPTVSGPAHIGHVRAAVAFDVLVRWARRCGLETRLVRNITDIDDKILRRSAEAGVPWWAFAAQWERDFEAAWRQLGLVPATFEPRATAHIIDQIELIERLIERGHAYPDGNGNVYFDVRSLPDYGSLTHQNLDDLGTTEDESQIDAATEAGKRDLRDFALWKAWKETEPQDAAWTSPWGRGRPGWHLECSAMSRRYLGEAFDIHGGGIDLRFPHHENEQAQSHAAGWDFVKIWMHNAWVTTKGEKMSKSMGNGMLVHDFLARGQAAALRVALGTVHYRSTIEWSDETLEKAQGLWDKFSSFVARTVEACPQVAEADSDALAQVELPAGFVAGLNDDLNLSRALAAVHATMKEARQAQKDQDLVALEACGLQVRAMLDILGLDPLSPVWQRCDSGSTEVAGAGSTGGGDAMSALDVLVSAVLTERAQARADKDWARADALRDRLAEAGVVVEDGKDGASWHL
ncbi:cysteine--tRNA ligase [Boudabousia tangfeifanii]|uniref:Cysteine--tRNA ligase n=1 Tax=Boudabousia tangfeifanii TaxID=1912795 RepID=A0A1D9MMS2_9ACTO|nr:cysteine--tRNA ligase [Boudabousia tangfeifanii]AOZ73548.1 cysteine--tRNA ligase [Boudabousia tangfeifanii]